MAQTTMTPCSYWVVRYVPNLERGEWVNVGVLLLDPGGPLLRTRFIEESEEFRRVKRLHPNYDERMLRSLNYHFQIVTSPTEDPEASLDKLGETFSNAVQFSPRHGLMTKDLEAELDRLYQRHVAPPLHQSGMVGRAFEVGRAFIRSQLNDRFRRAGLTARLERQVRIEEFTYKGDPLRLDFAYWRNTTRGFVHALSLDRDATQAKVLAYTAERIRQRLFPMEFTVVTDIQPEAKNERHHYVERLLGDEHIELVPVTELDPWVDRLRSELLA